MWKKRNNQPIVIKLKAIPQQPKHFCHYCKKLIGPHPIDDTEEYIQICGKCFMKKGDSK